MRDRRLLAAFVLVAAAALAWWCLSRSPSLETAASSPVHAADVASSPEAEIAGERASTPNGERVGARAIGGDAGVVEAHGLSISGTAVGKDGRPVKGTRIVAVAELVTGALPADEAGHVVATMAADDGSFAFEHLEPGAYELRAVSRAAVLHSAPVSARAGEVGVRLVLVGSAKVRGRVVRTAGEPVTAFKVDSLEVRDATGAFEVPLRDRATSVVFEAEGLATTLRKVDPRGDADVDLGEVVMDEGRSVGGKVLDARTQVPIPGAVVAVGDPEVLGRGRSATIEAGAVSTRNDGSFVMPHVAAVPLAIFARREGYRGVEQLLGPTDEFVVLRMDQGAVVTGQVFDEGGKPIYRATVDAWGEGTRLHVTAEKGFFRLEALPPGKLTVSVKTRPSERFDAQTLDVPEFGEVKLDFRAVGGGATLVVGLEGTLFPLLVAGDVPVPARTSELQALTASTIPPERVAAGYSFAHLAPGTYTLFMLERGEGAALQVARRVIAVGSGAEQHVAVPRPQAFSPVQADKGGRY